MTNRFTIASGTPEETPPGPPFVKGGRDTLIRPPLTKGGFGGGSLRIGSLPSLSPLSIGDASPDRDRARLGVHRRRPVRSAEG